MEKHGRLDMTLETRDRVEGLLGAESKIKSKTCCFKLLERPGIDNHQEGHERQEKRRGGMS